MKETTLTLANRFDTLLIGFSAKLGVPFLRFSIGIVFISPAYDLVAATVYWLKPEIIVPMLGVWEVAIGVCFLIPPLTRLGIFLLALQMPGTFLPLVLLPKVCFTVFPFGLTLEGQYIVKNLVIIGAALVIGAGIKTKK
jgi:hypothetical protein